MLTVTVSTRSGLAAHSHWLTDVRAQYWLTCQKWHAYGCLPSYLLGVLGVPFDVCSASPLLRTSHLQSVRWNIVSFPSIQLCVSLVCRVRLLLIIIATAYVSVSAETCKLIYRIHWYCNAASIHSSISNIGLTLVLGTCTGTWDVRMYHFRILVLVLETQVLVLVLAQVAPFLRASSWQIFTKNLLNYYILWQGMLRS